MMIVSPHSDHSPPTLTAFSSFAMHKITGKTRQFWADIRAPYRFNQVKRSKSDYFRLLTLLLTDIFALACAWQLAGHLNQFYSPIPDQLVWWTWLGLPSLFWVLTAITLIGFAYGGLYHTSTRSQNYIGALKIISFVFLSVLVVKYFYDPKLDIPRSLFFSAWISSIVFVLGTRLLVTLGLRQVTTDQPTKVFLIAGAHRLPKLGTILGKRSHYHIVGAALSTTANSPTTLQAIIHSGATEVLAEDIPPTELASQLYWHLRRSGIVLRLLPSSREILYRRGASEIFAGLPTLRVETPLIAGLDYRIKRMIDIFGSLFGLIILSPLLLGVSIIIWCSSPGPVFYRQQRIGLHGKPFKMWKFRTMVMNADKLQASLESQNESTDGVLFKIKNDPRIIPIGHFLRRSSIDELPQLFNVLWGQMSLVGPRPLPIRDVERFESWHHIRHQVLPGITGLWQISGRSDLADFDDAARLDLYYIDNWSLNLDLDILVETVRIVLFGKGAY
ncbi:MAG: sugar transferase [Microcystaceae cyanobacterium]